METLKLKSEKILATSTIFWFVITALSQLLFVLYIAKFYGGNAINGYLEAWNDMTLKGYISGDWMGNIFFASHLLMAFILTIGGLFQLVPWIRKNAIWFHKYIGRLFIFTALAISLGGLYLVWIRGATLNMNGAIAISLNALLIIFFSLKTIKTIKTVRGKMIQSHRKWALRAFIAVNGVWFFRVGFMAWIVINQEAKWSTENLDGPFDLVWAYGNYLLPLAILELFFLAKESQDSRKKYLMAILIFVCSLLIIAGTFGAYMFMWKPNM